MFFITIFIITIIIFFFSDITLFKVFLNINPLQYLLFVVVVVVVFVVAHLNLKTTATYIVAVFFVLFLLS